MDSAQPTEQTPSLEHASRLRTEEALRLSEERFSLAVRATRDVIYDWDMLANLVVWNANTEPMLGFTLEELEGPVEAWSARIHPDDLSAVEQQRAEVFERRETFLSEYRFQRKDGGYADLLDRGLVVRDAGGAPVRMVGAITDMTERKRAAEAVQHMALHDPLTDLPNRTLLQDRLHQAILLAQRDKTPLTLAVLDLNRFKEVNETLGHQAGDRLLQQVAQRLLRALRASDTVARVGGDEFALLLGNADLQGATHAVSKVLQALENPFVVEGHTLTIGASIGIAPYPEHGDSVSALMRRADVAMYEAKRAGGGFAVYDERSDQQLPSHLTLAAELRRAIQQDDLVLHFQPQVRMGSGQLEGIEALVRWRHAQRGLLVPEQFIPLAEQTGLIGPLNYWVIDAAIRQRQAWRMDGLELSVAVNLSMRDLQNSELPRIVARLLGRWNLPASSLKLEITESTVMADLALAIEVLGRLRELGTRIALDDFGTGYSSLSHLQRLPADELKIDRSFIRDVATNDGDAAIVRAAIDLGHTLGLTVVAEGIETEGAWNLLSALGCDVGQGFFLSEPLPAAELTSLLHQPVWGPARFEGASPY